ncbi:MAG: DUF5683 domain-containing protein [Candidatus Zixiibacteriota bacterium]
MTKCSVSLFIILASSTMSVASNSSEPPQGISILTAEHMSIRYSSSLSQFQEGPAGGAGSKSDADVRVTGHKSPAKAFLLSAAVPGLGQFYNGSKLKAAAFFTADVAAWVLHFKWQSDADDMTDAFNAFNDAHWSRDTYENKYLQWAYGVNDDELIDEQEISHRLPNTKTQQYYEMTGKYDQFAWGWDDAEYNGNTIDDYGPPPNNDPPLRITDAVFAPTSARRNAYETMRHDANNKYDQARAMVIAALANRMISGFEALFAAKHHNSQAGKRSKEFSRISVRTSLKSYHARRDTPFVGIAYRF